jgi:hypothetical protein
LSLIVAILHWLKEKSDMGQKKSNLNVKKFKIYFTSVEKIRVDNFFPFDKTK